VPKNLLIINKRVLSPKKFQNITKNQNNVVLTFFGGAIFLNLWYFGNFRLIKASFFLVQKDFNKFIINKNNHITRPKQRLDFVVWRV
jgi:hypothetical protein